MNDYNNSGVLFKNDNKTKQNHPDYTGNATIEGVPMKIAAWIKESKNGRKFLSINFQEKEQEIKPELNFHDEDF